MKQQSKLFSPIKLYILSNIFVLVLCPFTLLSTFSKLSLFILILTFSSFSLFSSISLCVSPRRSEFLQKILSEVHLAVSGWVWGSCWVAAEIRILSRFLLMTPSLFFTSSGSFLVFRFMISSFSSLTPNCIFLHLVLLNDDVFNCIYLFTQLLMFFIPFHREWGWRKRL